MKLNITFSTDNGLEAKWSWNNVPKSCVQIKNEGLFVESRFAKQYTNPAGKVKTTSGRKKIPPFNGRSPEGKKNPRQFPSEIVKTKH